MKKKYTAWFAGAFVLLTLAGCTAQRQPQDILPELTSAPTATPLPGPTEPPVPQPITEDVAIESPAAYAIQTTITLPTDGEDWPLVVFCHGFTGNRRGDGHFPRVARQLATRGIACAALDFAGNGDSELPFTNYTLSGMYDDIETVIAYMRENYSVSTDKLGLVGHSMGGRVVSLHLSDAVTAAALWSPANNSGADGFEFLAHSKAEREALLQQAKADGQVDLPTWGVTVSDTFLEEMSESDPCAVLEEYQGDVLVAFTAGDAEVLSEGTIELTLDALKARDISFVDLSEAFPDATHNYAVLPESNTTGTEVCDRIEKATVDFLADALL